MTGAEILSAVAAFSEKTWRVGAILSTTAVLLLGGEYLGHVDLIGAPRLAILIMAAVGEGLRVSQDRFRSGVCSMRNFPAKTPISSTGPLILAACWALSI